MSPAMFFEVTRVPELPSAVGAGEPGRVCVDQEVVVQAVLPGEHCLALVAFVGPEVKNYLYLKNYYLICATIKNISVIGLFSRTNNNTTRN